VLRIVRASAWLLTLSCYGCTDALLPGRGDTVEEVANALRDARPFQARLAGGYYYTPCTAPDRPQGAPPLRCGDFRLSSQDLKRAAVLANRLRSRVDSSGGSSADLRGVITLDVIAQPDDLDIISRAATRLQRLIDRDPTDVRALNDAAVVHALRGETAAGAFDILRAVDLLERAQLLDSTMVEVRFNRALVLDKLHLFGEAQEAWRAYLRVDSTSDWAIEARDRLERLESGVIHDYGRGATCEPARAVKDLGAARRLVRLDPQRARQCTIDSLVTVAGRQRRSAGRMADSLMTAAGLLGQVIVELNGDSTAAAIVREVSEADSDDSLAIAAGDFAAGQALFGRGNYAAARLMLRRAVDGLTDAPVLSHWATLPMAGAGVLSLGYPDADRSLRQAIAWAGDRPLIALRARAHWILSLSAARQGDLESALDLGRAASALYDSLGERENLGATQAITADVARLLGLVPLTARLVVGSLASYRGLEGSTLRHSALTLAGNFAVNSGLQYAAIACFREAARMSRQSLRARDVADAYLRLARAESQAGQLHLAERDLVRAVRAAGAIEDPAVLARTRADLAAAHAAFLGHRDPRASLANLDTVADYFRARRLGINLVPALEERSRLRLATGDTTGGMKDVSEALDVGGGELRRARSAVLRQSLRSVLRDLQLTELSFALDRGDTLRAVAGIVGMGGGASVAAGAPRVRKWLGAIPPGRTILASAVLPDQVIGFAMTRQTVRAWRRKLSRDSVGQLALRYSRLISAAGNSLVGDSVGGVLYDLLVAPASIPTREGAELVVLPDPVFEGVPFAVLRSGPTSRFLVQDHVVWSGGGPGELIRLTDTVGDWSASSALLISNPEFERGLFPELSPIPGAEKEVQLIRDSYPEAEVLAGAAAVSAAVSGRMKGSRVIHFAGHARSGGEDAGAGYLVLASAPGGYEKNVLFASDVARLDLRQTNLVVLSACDASSGTGRRGGGIRTLADAFVLAGAGGVVASLWQVDDQATALLMQSLHESLPGRGPAQALRVAQLKLLGSKEPRLRSPALWASFGYHAGGQVAGKPRPLAVQ
jgi:CHAT domain-containing protein/tetratricopeptide (TPR) repeat protein